MQNTEIKQLELFNSKIVQDVMDFHSVTDTPIVFKPTLPNQERIDLRYKLLLEEFLEVGEAIQNRDLKEIAKELADLVYVTVGAAIEFGIPFDAVWNAVQDSNMAKVDPVTGKVRYREDGKVLKPEGWQKPDIAKVLAS